MTLVTNFRLVPEGGWHLGVVAKRVYALEDGRRFVAAARKSAPEDEEATAWKPATDLSLRGAVWANSPGDCEATGAIRVGAHNARIRATGDRTIIGMLGSRPQLSDPLPFERIPLTHERCYGGFDRGAHERIGDPMAEHGARLGGLDFDRISRFTYPRNRRGVGFHVDVDVERLTGASVPNLDDPENPLLPEQLVRSSWDDWATAPIPVALDWIEPNDFPRSAHWGFPPKASGHALFPELGAGELSHEELVPRPSFPPVPSPRALCGTRFGLRGLRLRGGEEVWLDNLHPSWREIRTTLPRDAPIVRLQPPGCPWFDLEPQLDTVVLDLDQECLAMVWSAKLEVAGRYPEDELAQVVAEVRWP